MNTDLAARIEVFLSKHSVVRSVQNAPGLAVGTLKGPRPDNQDRATGGHIWLSTGEGLLFGVVCDGMGGMARGGEAASSAAAHFVSQLAVSSTQSIRGRIQDALGAANREVFNRFGGSGGTTLTSLVLTSGGEAWVGHVGDSRLYELVGENPPRLLTRDDTIGGQLAPTAAAEDTLDNRLLQFVGMGDGIEPHVFRVPTSSRTSFLITSDGAHGIGKRDLEGVVRTSANGVEVVRKLMFVAEAIGIEDNSSAVSVSPMEFETIKFLGKGTELGLWSATDKLEIWLAPPAQKEVPPRAEVKVEPDGQQRKKPSRGKPKSTKRVDKRDGAKPVAQEKPQLNIEFGSKNRGDE